MPTGLRAALREACKKLHGLTPHASAAENSEIGAWQDLADAPPTVAELLPLVDATHEVHWTAHGEDRRVRAPDGGAIAVEWRAAGRGYATWTEARLTAFDLGQPARLVEVAP